MTKEEDEIGRHLKDLARRAYNRGTAEYSDFLNLNEQNIFKGVCQELSYVYTDSFGGYELAERQIAVFLPEAPMLCPRYPIACIKIAPLQKKFSEPLTHRDYLGAVLNLGIERSCLGDILAEEDSAYIFCLEHMADYICENLTRVKHTSVRAERTQDTDFDYEPKYTEITGTVASVRLDRLLSLAFGSSRSSLASLTEQGKVFVNGKLVTSNSYLPAEGDVISVRGLGRFRFCGSGGVSKKGRQYVTLKKFV